MLLNKSVTRSGKQFKLANMESRACNLDQIHEREQDQGSAIEALPMLAISCLISHLDLPSILALRIVSKGIRDTVSAEVEKVSVRARCRTGCYTCQLQQQQQEVGTRHHKNPKVSPRTLHSLYNSMKIVDAAFPRAKHVTLHMPDVFTEISLVPEIRAQGRVAGLSIKEPQAAYLYKGVSKRLENGFVHLKGLTVIQMITRVSMAPLAHLSNLQTLDLSRCLFESSDLPKIACQMKALTELCLIMPPKDQFQIISGVLPKDLSALTALCNLQKLQLGLSPDMKDAHIEALSLFGEQLQYLDIRLKARQLVEGALYISTQGFAALGKLRGLKHLRCPGLVRFCGDDSPIGPNSEVTSLSVAVWQTVLAPMMRCLRTLEIDFGKIPNEIIDCIAKVLEESEEGLDSLVIHAVQVGPYCSPQPDVGYLPDRGALAPELNSEQMMNAPIVNGLSKVNRILLCTSKYQDASMFLRTMVSSRLVVQPGSGHIGKDGRVVMRHAWYSRKDSQGNFQGVWTAFVNWDV